jgi:hypothetical protein
LLPSHLSVHRPAIAAVATIGIIVVALDHFKILSPLGDSSCRWILLTNTTIFMGWPPGLGGGDGSWLSTCRLLSSSYCTTHGLYLRCKGGRGVRRGCRQGGWRRGCGWLLLVVVCACACSLGDSFGPLCSSCQAKNIEDVHFWKSAPISTL